MRASGGINILDDRSGHGVTVPRFDYAVRIEREARSAEAIGGAQFGQLSLSADFVEKVREILARLWRGDGALLSPRPDPLGQ